MVVVVVVVAVEEWQRMDAGFVFNMMKGNGVLLCPPFFCHRHSSTLRSSQSGAVFALFERREQTPD